MLTNLFEWKSWFGVCVPILILTLQAVQTHFGPKLIIPQTEEQNYVSENENEKGKEKSEERLNKNECESRSRSRSRSSSGSGSEEKELSDKQLNEFKEQIIEQIREEMREEIKEEIREEVKEEVKEEVWEEVKEEIREEVKEELKVELKTELQIEVELDRQHSQEEAQIKSRIDSLNEGSIKSRSSSSFEGQNDINTLIDITQTPKILKRTRERKSIQIWEIRWNEIVLGEQIAYGGFGAVFKGTFDDEEVAIKYIQNPSSVLREAQLLSLLSHRHIVGFKGICVNAPSPCIVMEYCGNGDLFTLIHKRPDFEINTNLVIKWSREICSALDYLHNSAPQKIIHADLKSPNVLVSDQYEMKLIDFGLSRKDTEKQSKFGTFAWMSPEMLKNEKNIDEKVDVWSFGVILWELVTRQIPFDGMEPFAVAFQVASGNLRLPLYLEGMCPVLNALMEGCFKERTERMTFFEIIQILDSLQSQDGGLSTDECISNNREYWKEEIQRRLAEGTTASFSKKIDLDQREIELAKREKEMDKKEEILKQKIIAVEQQYLFHKQLLDKEFDPLKILKVGDTIPDFQMENTNGIVISLYDLLKVSPVVLYFIHGDWTGFCQTELQNLKSLVQSFDYEKVRLVAISPQIPSLNRKMVEDNHLNFEIVYDQDLTYAKKLGIVLQVPRDQPLYTTEFGIDFSLFGEAISRSESSAEDLSGNTTPTKQPKEDGVERVKVFNLPLPYSLVIEQTKIIVYTFLNPSFDSNFPSLEILEAIDSICAT